MQKGVVTRVALNRHKRPAKLEMKIECILRHARRQRCPSLNTMSYEAEPEHERHARAQQATGILMSLQNALPQWTSLVHPLLIPL